MPDIDTLASDNKGIISDVDLISRHTGLGEITSSVHNMLYGVNHLGQRNPIPYNTDNVGLVFFTKPRMNLSDINLGLDRVFTPLLTNQANSYQRAIRAILDPVGATLDKSCPLVDNKTPFIPLLSNNLISLTGWPDPVALHYTSPEGPEKESWSMIDDVAVMNGQFTLNANFRNIEGDPITLLIFLWIRYAAQVYGGLFMPHMDSVIENEKDYETRIYRLMLDPSRQYVQRIAACGSAFPAAPSLGQAFNYNIDKPYVEDMASSIQVPFQCTGVDYQDPITIEEFNFLSEVFNPDLQEGNRNTRMVEVPKRHLARFSNRGYFRINNQSSKLEVWVDRDEYHDTVNRSRAIDNTTAPTTATPTPP